MSGQRSMGAVGILVRVMAGMATTVGLATAGLALAGVDALSPLEASGLGVGCVLAGGALAAGELTMERASGRRRQVSARQRAAEEVLQNVQRLDEHLAYADAALTDASDRQLHAMRRSVAPALADALHASSTVHMGRQMSAHLRQAFNSRQLRTELTPSTVADLEEAEPSAASAVHAYLDQLRVVADREESWLSTMAQGVGGAEVDRFLERLRRAATVAAALAVQAVTALDRSIDVSRIATLDRVQGARLVHGPTRNDVLADVAREEAAVVAGNAAETVQAAGTLIEEAAADWAALQRELLIDRAEGATVVAAKARTLRQLGRFEEAVEAHRRFAEWFSGENELYASWARVASTITELLAQRRLCGPRSGVFIAEVDPDGDAADRGVQVGDVVWHAGQRELVWAEDLQAVFAAAADNVVPLHVLRIVDDEVVHLDVRVEAARPGVRYTSF